MATIVLGLGRTGLAVVRFLLGKGLEVIAADTREKPPNLKIFKEKFPQVPLHLGELPQAQMLQADAICVPPGLSLDSPIFAKLKAAGVPICGDIELFARYKSLPALGITGANGKSTVTSLVGAMAKRAELDYLVGGNIGVPALDLLALESSANGYVLELSSFQLETTDSLELEVAAILNITRDHLDRHGTFESYVAAKQKIYKHAKVAVYNRQDSNTFPQTKVARHVTFGLDAPEEGHFGLREKEGQTWLSFGEQTLLPTAKIRLFGEHNVLNCLSALCIGYANGFPMAAMLEELQQFEDLKHRCQIVREFNQVVWINDTKGTNVGAAQAALASVAKTTKGKIILLAGGKAKDKDFSELLPLIKAHVRQVLLFGADAQTLYDAFHDSAPCLDCKDLKSAILQAAKVCQPGDTVLLSPACTSLDTFANFEERGEVFIQAVNNL